MRRDTEHAECATVESELRFSSPTIPEDLRGKRSRVRAPNPSGSCRRSVNLSTQQRLRFVRRQPIAAWYGRCTRHRAKGCVSCDITGPLVCDCCGYCPHGQRRRTDPSTSSSAAASRLRGAVSLHLGTRGRGGAPRHHNSQRYQSQRPVRRDDLRHPLLILGRALSIRRFNQ